MYFRKEQLLCISICFFLNVLKFCRILNYSFEKASVGVVYKGVAGAHIESV